MGTYCKKGKSKPVNLGLYNRIKRSVKQKVKRWPSAYASGQVVRMYKQKGGKYRCTSMGKLHCSSFGNGSFGSLDRWFKEKWVDVCTGKPCGRKKVGDKRKYPYCRPSRRISGETPRTSKEISRSELKRRCTIKHRIKGKRLNFGKKVKTFLYNPKNPKKSFDVYIDKNPNDTISIKYKTVQDVKNTINKLEKLYKSKKYTHKRIKQVAMIMKVRLRVLKNKKPQQYNLAKKYFDFLGKRTKLDNKKRYKFIFKH
jgi:hypothetical protein